MEKLKCIKKCLIEKVQEQMNHLDCVDTKELGEVIDMIKDLEETMYYCTIVEAMEEKEEKQDYNHYAYYTGYPYYMDRDMDRHQGKMYYPMDYNRLYYPESGERGPNDHLRMYTNGNGNGSNNSSNGGSNTQYSEREMPIDFRDSREGRSPSSRKMYMESKELHHDKAQKMKELEKYMQELTLDIAEMIEDSSPEEKQLLHKKISALASKIETL